LGGIAPLSKNMLDLKKYKVVYITIYF